jgi:predicted glycoside hydrolase/deacetylase ChbG (UPF0249 family)
MYGEYIKVRNKLLKDLKRFNKEELNNKNIYMNPDFYDTFIKARMYYMLYKQRGLNFIIDYDMKNTKYGFTRRSEMINNINDLII